MKRSKIIFYKKYGDYLEEIQKSDILIGFLNYEWDSLRKMEQTPHMWQELGLRDKKCFMVDPFWNWPMMMCRLRIQKLKIGLLGDFEKMCFLCFYIIGV